MLYTVYLLIFDKMYNIFYQKSWGDKPFKHVDLKIEVVMITENSKKFKF